MHKVQHRLLNCILVYLIFGRVNSLSPTDFNFRYDHAGFVIAVPKGVTLITPIKATSVFYNSSTIGFWTGLASGTINFTQANFPSHPATVVDVELKIPGSLQDRTFAIDILYEGNLDARYCEDTERFVEIHRFLLPARKNFYVKSFKRRDISIIDEYESIVGRAIRIICLDCHFRSEKNGGCSLIGRSEDDVYVEQDEIQPNNLPYFPMELPPGAKLLVRDLYQNSDWSRNSANYN